MITNFVRLGQIPVMKDGALKDGMVETGKFIEGRF